MDDLRGKVLDGYRLLDVLGQGSNGTVYLGESLASKQQVAVKVISRYRGHNIGSYLAEAFRPAALLNHPHILRLLEISSETDLPYLVMEYAPSGSISYRHPPGQSVPLPTVVVYAKQVAEAVQYAHDLDLLHGHIRPREILLGQDSAVLLSFNDAFLEKALTACEVSDLMPNFSGMTEYMAREQMLGHPQKASDQFALGVVVYEWLTGKRLFQAPSLSNPPIKFGIYSPRSIRSHTPAVPEAVEAVVQKALEKYPEERYESVAAFAAALEEASRGKV